MNVSSHVQKLLQAKEKGFSVFCACGGCGWEWGSVLFSLERHACLNKHRHTQGIQMMSVRFDRSSVQVCVRVGVFLCV